MRISDWSSDVCSSDLERDLQELDRVRRDASRNSIAPAVTAPASREPERDRRQADEASRKTPSEQSRVKNARAAQSQLRVIETVASAALFDNPDAVARVIKVAKIGRAHVCTPVNN